MIENRSQILLITASVLLIVTVWQLIQRDKLRPAYALLWLLASFSFFFFILFKQLGRRIANYFSVEYTPSFFFALALFFIIVLLLFHTSVLSSLAKKTTELAEHMAILQWRVEKLEEQVRQTILFEIPSSKQNQSDKINESSEDGQSNKQIISVDEDKLIP